MMPRFTRRTALRGMVAGAAVSVALPPLECWLTSKAARAEGGGFPRRFGLFFWGNGNLPEKWVPQQTGAEWEVSEQLAPLRDHTSEVSVISGLRVQTPNILPHGSGAAGILSGAPVLPNGTDADDSMFTAPSLDQILAEGIGGSTRFRSLELAVQPDALGLSFRGAGNRVPPEPSPSAVFERMFGGSSIAVTNDGEPDPRLRLRRSVLDAIGEDAQALRSRVGYQDRIRLEEHFEGIRDLERQLASLEEAPPSLEACGVPGEPAAGVGEVGEDGRQPMSAISRAMVDLLVMGLACDQTRVFSLWFSEPVNNILFPTMQSGHHQLTHDEPGEQPQVNRIVIQIMEEFAYLVQRLRAIPEGDSTLLDNCAVLATSDVSGGREHSVDDYPVLIAGSACGRLRKGIHYRSESAENASIVGLSLLRAMGLNVSSFGSEAGLVTDGLSAIET